MQTVGRLRAIRRGAPFAVPHGSRSRLSPPRAYPDTLRLSPSCADFVTTRSILHAGLRHSQEVAPSLWRSDALGPGDAIPTRRSGHVLRWPTRSNTGVRRLTQT